MDYSPKLWHGVFILLIGTGLFCLSIQWPADALYLQLAGGICWALCVYVAWMLGAEVRTRLYDALTMFCDAIKNVPDDRLDALGIAHPQIPLRWRGGKLTETFEDTGVNWDLFQRFMKDSNPIYVSPVRNWPEGTQRKAWEAITSWLIRERYVMPDSANGNQSLLWYGRKYDLAWSRYMAPRYLADLSDAHSPSAVGGIYLTTGSPQDAEAGSTQGLD